MYINISLYKTGTVQEIHDMPTNCHDYICAQMTK